MASKRLYEPISGFLAASRLSRSHATRSSQWTQARSLTTESPTPAQSLEQVHAEAHLSSTDTKPILEDTFTNLPPPTPATRQPYQPPPNPFLKTATCTLHSFPALEPLRQVSYPGTHLLLPLRRDILHKAVIFEGDRTRQGTASTKWRGDVHGSNRKVRPQKGTGSARLGDKKSPMLRGGGVAFGPKPRDFSTDLPNKIYDLAFRTALSYRYRRGELVIIGGEAEISRTGPGSARWMMKVLEFHKWDKSQGRSLFVTKEKRPNLFAVLEEEGMDKHARARSLKDVDVKDLLEGGRVVIERKALDQLFEKHVRDLSTNVRVVV
ncbi:hypothetical protein MBLNU457_1855t1 [Dothideomycetes sp. NU457]